MRKTFTSSILYALAISVTVFVWGCSETQDPVKVYNRGARAYNNGDYVKAIGMFKLALQTHREYSLPMIGLAKCYLHFAREDLQQGNKVAARKDIEEAFYWITQAINADPANQVALETKQKILKFRSEL